MPVPKGTRIGGRQKGTPNKRTQEVQEIFKRYRCNPIIRMIKMLDHPLVQEDVDRQIALLKELASYHSPKRKPVDEKGSSAEEVHHDGVLLVGGTKEQYIAALGQMNGHGKSVSGKN